MAIDEIYKDRRNSERISFMGQVDLVLGGKLYKEESDNISDTGIFLKSKHPENYHVFDNLTLSFQPPDAKPVKHSATVIRKVDAGIGILFSGLNRPSAYRFSPRIDGLFRSKFRF